VARVHVRPGGKKSTHDVPVGSPVQCSVPVVVREAWVRARGQKQSGHLRRIEAGAKWVVIIGRDGAARRLHKQWKLIINLIDGSRMPQRDRDYLWITTLDTCAEEIVRRLLRSQEPEIDQSVSKISITATRDREHGIRIMFGSPIRRDDSRPR